MTLELNVAEKRQATTVCVYCSVTHFVPVRAPRLVTMPSIVFLHMISRISDEG